MPVPPVPTATTTALAAAPTLAVDAKVLEQLQTALPTIAHGLDPSAPVTELRPVSPTPLHPLSPTPLEVLDKKGALPKKVDHGRWHQPYTVAQGDRGTCWAFAGAAALEAAYRRQGVDVRLSVEYAFAQPKSWGNSLESAKDGISSSLNGFQGWTDVVHHLSVYSVPEWSLCRYQPSQAALLAIENAIPQAGNAVLPDTQGVVADLEKFDWFQYDQRLIPLPARWAASYGVATYGRVAGTIDNVKAVLAAGYDAVIGVCTDKKQPTTGTHVILAYGYDDDTQELLVKNSWSTPGFERMRYTGDPSLGELSGSTVYYVKTVKPVRRQLDGAWLGRWAIDHDGWRGRLVIRTFFVLWEGADQPSAKNPVLLGRWYGEDGTSKPVVGWFEGDGRVLRCTIGDQPFELALHSGELDRASGRCWWNGQEFGVVATRTTATGGALDPKFDRTAATIGQWEIDADGEEGTLDVGPNPLYRRASDGKSSSVTYADGKGNRVDGRITFGTDLEMLFHTRERGLFGGIASANGVERGLTGRLAEALYIVRPDGRLDWAQHTGRPTLTFDWKIVEGVGSGWTPPLVVAGGRDGIVYAIMPNGDLNWYAHIGRNQGTGQWLGPTKVGVGWQGIKHLVAGDPGILYGMSSDGTLHWYQHTGRRDGTFRWEGPCAVGPAAFTRVGRPPASVDWGAFHTFTAAPGGILYGIGRDGTLQWYRHRGADHGFRIWEGPRVVGVGWQDVDQLVATGSGYLYARFREGSARAGELWLYRHLGYRTGDFSWRDGAKVGQGWGPQGVRTFFAS